MPPAKPKKPLYDWPKLREPFPSDAIEWRIGHAGQSGDKIWALALAYITARHVQDRLDDVFGPENWRNDYSAGVDGGIMCMLSVRVGNEWLTKMDGAPATDIEAVKGGLSAAMKRAAVQWGIGRYLYDLSDNFAKVHNGGKLRGSFKDDKNHYVRFKWDPPKLPAWALPPPDDGKTEAPEPAKDTTNVVSHGQTGGITAARVVASHKPTATPSRTTEEPDADDELPNYADELAQEVKELERMLAATYDPAAAEEHAKKEIVRRAKALPEGPIRDALSKTFQERWPK